MAIGLTASGLLINEAYALLSRLARVRPFALQTPMVAAANISTAARSAIDCFLAEGRAELRGRVGAFIRWMRAREGRAAGPAEAQRRFSVLRLRFNDVLTQFDIFADVLTQRSEHNYGVWMAGLDVFAADALALPGYYEAPPIVCYLDRGHGAAIRRVRTRLPGGAENPVGIIRIPRERMVGSGIGSSLVHEVGHQGATLLDLMETLPPILHSMHRHGGRHAAAWRLWGKWLSEILADFWSVARLGLTSTLGLIGVVSLPTPFVFRFTPDDPHPIPWIRVVLSCAMGAALYPHPQWSELLGIWKTYYPAGQEEASTQQLLAGLESAMPEFVELLLDHRPKALRGRSLREVMTNPELSPEQLLAQFEKWRAAPNEMRSASPTYAFAVFGQARAEGRLRPDVESDLLASLLAHWAMRRSSGMCA